MIESAVIWVLIVEGVGVVGIGCGLVLTIRKNGKDSKEVARKIAAEQADRARKEAARDQDLKNNQANILKRLDDEKTGLSALSEGVHSMREHCAGVVGGVHARLEGHDREIKELKQKSRS